MGLMLLFMVQDHTNSLDSRVAKHLLVERCTVAIRLALQALILTDRMCPILDRVTRQASDLLFIENPIS